MEEGKTIKEISDWKSVMKLPYVVFANVSIKEGEVVPKITDSSKRPGFVIVEGKNREEVMERVEKYLKIIKKEIRLR